jgi:transcriptional regulator
MAKPAKQTAHAQLDELRQLAATERKKARDVKSALEAATVRVGEADRAVTAAYALEDAKLAVQRRMELEAAEAEVVDLQRRVDAAGLRVHHAQQQLDEFQREHAHDLLDERAADARQVALELTRAGHEVIRLHRAYLALRMDIDALVGHLPGATPRNDGPPPEHPWEAQLGALERVVRETPEVPALTPTWAGLEHRKQQDEQLSQHRRATPNLAGRAPS